MGAGESDEPRRGAGEAGVAEPRAEASRPGAPALALAVALAAVHALWSLFQWTQLILARRGGDHFCGLGEPGSCAAVWDLPLAGAIQDATSVPVAGWGLVWSAVAFALPLWALVRRARGRPIEPVWSAALLTVLAGIASVVLLAVASLNARVFCTTCVITYAMVLAYAAVSLGATASLRPAQIRRGALLALCATLVAFLALLYPGLRTPQSSAAEESAFLEAAKRSIEAQERPLEPEKPSTPPEDRPTEVAKRPTEPEERPVGAAEHSTQVETKPSEPEKPPTQVEEKPTQVAKRSIEAKQESVEPEKPPARVEESSVPAAKRPEAAELEEMISRLSPQHRQALSDGLAAYSRNDRVPMHPARMLVGSPSAPVRITEFTDVLCGHCATLHKSIGVLREMVPSGSFALEPRQFPLDSECNPAVEMSSGKGVSCLAARAMICVEEDWMAFAGALFENQRWLTKRKIYDIASRFVPRQRFEDCISSPETEAKLEDDIAWALDHEIQGTPLVLVNGREVPHNLQLLYAMVLAKADPAHPAFAVLPPPQPQARLP
jgi:outer membrane biosynthesis protein TonB